MRRKEWDGGATIIVGGQGPGVLMPWELSSQWVEAATGTQSLFLLHQRENRRLYLHSQTGTN